MNVIQSLIVDDEELARKLLLNYADRLPHLEIVQSCKNPLETLPYLQQGQVDLLLLDIQMPELTGIEFLKTLRYKPLVIFTTAYPDFALEGFSLDAVDYLLKPFSFERFVQGINKVNELLPLRRNTYQPSSSPSQNLQAEKNHIMVRSEHKIFRVWHKDILFIQGMREYVAFQTASGRILSLNSLKQLNQDLPQPGFMRVHKSYIVAINKIDAVEGNMLIIGSHKIPMGSNFKEGVLQQLLG